MNSGGMIIREEEHENVEVSFARLGYVLLQSIRSTSAVIFRAPHFNRTRIDEVWSGLRIRLRLPTRITELPAKTLCHAGCAGNIEYSLFLKNRRQWQFRWRFERRRTGVPRATLLVERAH